MPWLRLIFILLLAGLLAGCGAMGRWPSSWSKPPATRSESLQRMDPARIQADTMGFADRFVTAMIGICDELERRAPTPAAKDAAHQLKTDLALGAISDAVNPRPVAGLIDMVVLVTLQRQIAEDPWSTQTFGPNAVILVQALRRQEADLRAMASRYLTDAQLTEITQLTQRWQRAHPDSRSVSHVHLADLPEANPSPEENAKPPSIFALLFFDPTGDLDPAVREIELSRATSERMFFYLQRMPLLLQLQLEDLYRHMLLVPQVQRVLDNASAIAASTTRFTSATTRFTDLVADFPNQLADERQHAIEQMASALTQQREGAIRQLAEATAAERDAAIQQFTRAMAAQREAAITQLASAATVQREAALTEATTRITSQREDAIQQAATALSREQEAFVLKLEAAVDRSVDRLLLRLAALAVALVVLIGGTTLVCRRLSRAWRAP